MEGTVAGLADWYEGEYHAHRLTRPSEAYKMMMNNPDSFLRKYAVDIEGIEAISNVSTVGRANMMNGAAARRPGTILGTHSMHTTESFKIRPRLDNGLDYRCYYPMPAHFINMHPSNQAVSWYALTGGPDLMLTAKLSGCSFVIRKNQLGVVEAAHLQPTQESGLALQQRMQTGGQTAYGRVNYNFETRTATILGVRHGGRWHVFAQKWRLGERLPTVVSVHEIFHG